MRNGFKSLLASQFLLLLATSGANLCQAAQAAEENPPITIRVYDYAQLPVRMLHRAEREAARIFREAGIETRWLDCPLTTQQLAEHPACGLPLEPTDLVLRIHPKFRNAGGAFRDTTLGFSLLAEDRTRSAYASVFSDYVERLAEQGRATREQILGHAIAHELGHLLLGSMGHSTRGLMRARWNEHGLQLAAVELLLFTREQAEVIRSNVQKRVKQEVVLKATSRTPPE